MVLNSERAQSAVCVRVLCQLLVPREHLPSCNVAIVDLYNLDLLSWSNHNLWASAREQREKKKLGHLILDAQLGLVS